MRTIERYALGRFRQHLRQQIDPSRIEREEEIMARQSRRLRSRIHADRLWKRRRIVLGMMFALLGSVSFAGALRALQLAEAKKRRIVTSPDVWTGPPLHLDWPRAQVSAQEQAALAGRIIIPRVTPTSIADPPTFYVQNYMEHAVLSYNPAAIPPLIAAGFLPRNSTDVLGFTFLDRRATGERRTVYATELNRTFATRGVRVSRRSGLELENVLMLAKHFAAEESQIVENDWEIRQEVTIEANAAALGIYRYVTSEGATYDIENNRDHRDFHLQMRHALRADRHLLLFHIEAIDPRPHFIRISLPKDRYL